MTSPKISVKFEGGSERSWQTNGPGKNLPHSDGLVNLKSFGDFQTGACPLRRACMEGRLVGIA